MRGRARGDKAHLKLILQNALDVPIKGRVELEVPARKFLQKTFLSTLPRVPFQLGAIEVITLDISIQTQLETPEGDYELKVRIRDERLGKGKRIRGKKRGKEWRKAIAKSIVSSALLLPFGGARAQGYRSTSYEDYVPDLLP